MQPELASTQVEVNAMIERIKTDKADAEEEMKVVEETETEA